MTYSMKLNTDVDEMIFELFNKSVKYSNFDCWEFIHAQAKVKMSREIDLIDDRLTEQLEQNT
jgi:hypothetical protein